MDLKKLMDDMQSHPIVVAVVFFIVVFVVYNVAKPKGSALNPLGTLAPGTYIDPVTGAVTRMPIVQDTYAQQYNQYPVTNTGGGPIINQNPPIYPVPTPPPTPVNPPAPQSGWWHGVLTIQGSIHPANIGPWIAGRHVQYKGTWYVLHPGDVGRLWGDILGGTPGILMWDGSDWGKK